MGLSADQRAAEEGLGGGSVKSVGADTDNVVMMMMLMTGTVGASVRIG